MTDGQKSAVRIGLIIFVIAAFAYSGISFWNNAGTPRGSEKDEVLLCCTGCNQDSVVSAAEYHKLPHDSATGKSQCPKCGAMTAVIASVRCPKCQRAIPPQPPGAPMVCPYCKAPMFEPDDEEAGAPVPAGQ